MTADCIITVLIHYTNFIEVKMLPNAPKDHQATFMVNCLGPCRDINIHLTVESGDADLYAKEDEPPKIENSNCEICPLCKSRDSDLEDTCNISSSRGDSFFLVVTAHKAYTGGTIVFVGFNLRNVTRYDDY